jgi:hypothetical protein
MTLDPDIIIFGLFWIVAVLLLYDGPTIGRQRIMDLALFIFGLLVILCIVLAYDKEFFN